MKPIALYLALSTALTCIPASVPAYDLPMWAGTWAASPTGLQKEIKVGTYTYPSPMTIKGTIRYRFRISMGGSQIRLRFSNEYSDTALDLASATVGIAGEGLSALPGSLKRATFGGKNAITIPGGAPALSDPIEFAVPAGSDLVVSVFVPRGASGVSCTPDYPLDDQTTISGSDATLEERVPPANCLGTLRPLVSEVDVLADHPHKVIVAVGDSITDAFVDPKTGDRGWPGVLARRLEDQGGAVVNAGISGNQLLRTIPIAGASALARLDRDVLSVPGVTHIALMEGVNDIGLSGVGGLLGDTPLIRSEDLIAAYSQIVERAHARKIKVLCATITPLEGVSYTNYYSAEKEKVRENFNEWVRSSKTCDGTVDFDRTVRDPDHPRKIKKEYDSGDHLHPNALGQRAMGEAINLHLFD
jgi:lysophospholipase L1-like esterase